MVARAKFLYNAKPDEIMYRRAPSRHKALKCQVYIAINLNANGPKLKRINLRVFQGIRKYSLV